MTKEKLMKILEALPDGTEIVFETEDMDFYDLMPPGESDMEFIHPNTGAKAIRLQSGRFYHMGEFVSRNS